MYAKDPCEAKFELLINKREGLGLKHYNDSKAFLEYWNDKDDIYKKKKEEYNPSKEHKIKIVFDHMIDDMFSNKKLQ